MACESCGEKPKNHSKDFTKAVVEINNPEKLVLLRKVMVPASMGDDTEFLPEIGKFYNVILQYEANSHIYIYSSDGIPTKIDASVSQEILDKIAELEEDLVTETELRQTGDADLRDRIDVVADNLETEETAREEADTALAGDILAERTARTNADTALQAAVSAEQTARQTADANLQDQIDDIEEVIPAQASASNQLADKNFVNSSVATNTANYISNNGQPFNSLAELEAYSGPLTNNDYAFVTGTDAQGNTFYDRYKYNANTGEWAFEYELNNSSFTANQWATINSGITSGDVTKLQGLANIQTIGANLTLVNGELSATDTTYTAGSGLFLTGTQFSVDTTTIATQSDLTAGLATKQDTLTAGSNIQINNNTISATDTTYSDFVGTDGTVAGNAGLVPAPATTDAGKFLKADGTWDEAGSPINVVQTTGTSTTDVMSQNATTSMVFADPSYRGRIQIGRGASISGSGVAIGELAVDLSGGYTFNTLVGSEAQVQKRAGTAIGGRTVAGGIGSIALGYGARTFTDGVMSINAQDNLGYNSSNYRLLTGLYDGQSDHDAVTVGQLNAAIAGAGVTELTSADYNWPTTGTKTAIAIWLLPPGIYHNAQGVNHLVAANATTVSNGSYWIIGNPESGTPNDVTYYEFGEDTRNFIGGVTNKSTGAAVETWARYLTWGEVQNSTGTSTYYPMSQNATTSMVFADPSTRQKVSIGAFADVGYARGVGLGADTAVYGANSVALGFGSFASSKGEVAIGLNPNGQYTNYGYNDSAYRLLTGLYDPQNDHDAATKGYVDTAVASAGANEISSQDWSALWQ